VRGRPKIISIFSRDPNLSKNLLILSLVIMGGLLLFIGKALHMDDTFWIWTAQQIQISPLDFYGYKANWFGSEQWMYNITKTPPLFSYYLAVGSKLLGLSEISLHMIGLGPALLLGLGTYFLSREFCRHPLLATLLSICTPLFFLTSSTLMCDTLMVGFWVWSFVLWMVGLKNKNFRILIFASILLSGCVLTKFNGITLIPLLLMYTFLKNRKLMKWTPLLLFPLFSLGLLEWWTHKLYGEGLIRNTMIFSTGAQNISFQNLISKGLISLSFLEGTTVIGLLFGHLVWAKKRGPLVFQIILTSVVIVALTTAFIGPHLPSIVVKKGWLYFQFSLWVLAGLNVLTLSYHDVKDKKDPLSWILLLWIVGTVLFAGFINWSMTGRALLPLVPAIGILVVRRLEASAFFNKVQWKRKLVVPLSVLSLFTFIVLAADSSLATNSKTMGQKLGSRFTSSSSTLWFQGHWGFQYYMEKEGGKPVDFRYPGFKEGDIMVVPINNTNVKLIERDRMNLVQTIDKPSFPFCATMNKFSQAGFYSDLWGILPFSFGPIPPEKYLIFQFGNKSKREAPQ